MEEIDFVDTLDTQPVAHRDRPRSTRKRRSASNRKPSQAEPPLLIDLDRCLLRSDLLLESILAYLAQDIRRIFAVLRWMLRGRAVLKRKLAEAAIFDFQLVPENADVVALAVEQKHLGRSILLVTASDAMFAEHIVARFPFLDAVIGSDGETNLKGEVKAARIRKEFPQGYDYIGDSSADLPIWAGARKIVAVEPSWRTVRRINRLNRPTVILPRRPRFRPLLKAARLHQLAKNTLVFVPAILSGVIAEPRAVLACLLAFAAMGLVAIGTYLVNDLCDLSSDRAHWSKRERPLANGDLPISTAITIAPIFIGVGLAVAAGLGLEVLLALSAYTVLTLAYSFRLKRVPILDCVVLASLFSLRLAIGIAAVGVVASPWLLVFSMFLFTSLSFAKRTVEVDRMIAKGIKAAAGRGYVAADGPLLLALGVATASSSILIMVLYLIFDAFNHSFYGNPQWLWLLPLGLFFWVSRIWMLCGRGELNDDPVAFAIRDRPSLALAGGMFISFVLAWSGMPF